MTAARRVASRRRRRSAGYGVLAVTLSMLLTVTVDESPVSAEPAAVVATRSDVERPVIKVDAARTGASMHRNLLGVNHRWFKNGEGAWDVNRDALDPVIVNRMRQLGVQALRYPGGTVATMFRWRKAVGTNRGCQINGHGLEALGFPRAQGATSYGPDEFMRLSRRTGARPIIMAPFVGQTPQDAAAWVEYMNARLGTNPNGGHNYARDRAANGHPASYHVTRWEVGNEPHVAPQRYGLSPNQDIAIKQYANGGRRVVEGEALGKNCDHRTEGVRSNGRADQVFSVLYRPFRISTLKVKVAGQRWRRVANLRGAAPGAKVFTANPKTGDIAFGSGRHGAIPKRGVLVRASYVNTYEGFFSFARQMKAVDPSISVCSSWGNSYWHAAAGKRRYDCQATHLITNFRRNNADHWATRLEGHDKIMLGLVRRRIQFTDIDRKRRPGSGLLVTEMDAIFGDFATFPHWSASASIAVYMASMYALLLKRGVTFSTGGDLLGQRGSGLLGKRPGYTYSAEARMRQAILPMFTAGGRVVRTRVRNNPIRDPNLDNRGSYAGLDVVATRAPGRLYVEVINRLPWKAVRGTIELDHFSSQGTAVRRRMTSDSFASWNQPQRETVRLTTGSRKVGIHDFRARFPAHSVTLFSLKRR